MLFPLLGLRGNGPLLSKAITGDESADVAPWEVVRRLGLAAPLVVVLSDPSASPTPEQLKLLVETQCVVGPFSLDEPDCARAWLDAGAKYALVTAPAAGAGRAPCASLCPKHNLFAHTHG
jgi:hypothetical protein